jgi:hypothetical protein
MYMDAPFVENSFVYTDHPDDGTSLSTFDQQTANWQPCEISGATVTLLDDPVPNKPNYLRGGWTWDEPLYGGAITESSEPTPGGLAEGATPERHRYCQANGPHGVRFDFSSPQTYFGIFWQAGSSGNVITFFKDGVAIGSTSTEDVISKIGDQTNSDYYFGNPVTWTDGDPATHVSTAYTPEPFAYLHFFANNGQTFDRVELSAPGDGFEFDNVVYSDRTDLLESAPSGRLVHVGAVTTPEPTTPIYQVSFDPNGVGASGNLPNQWTDTPLPGQCSGIYPNQQCLNYPGFFLDSWNTEANGSGATFSEWDSPPFTSPTILYAQWSGWLCLDPSPPGQELAQQCDYFHPDDSLPLPDENSLSSPVTYPGHHIDKWVYGDQDIGPVGFHATRTQLWRAMDDAWPITAHWVEDTATTTPAPTAIVPESFPVDPRATSVKLPEMPISGGSAASVCVSEVDSAHDPVGGSDLTQSVPAPSPSGPNLTSAVTVNSGTVLGRTPNRYLLYKVAATDDVGCTSGNTYYIRLYPLQLGDKRSANADLSKH